MDRNVVGLVKAGRGALHWSQENLAEESGVSVATIRRFESSVNSIRYLCQKHMEEAKKPSARRDKILAIVEAFYKNGIIIERDAFSYKFSVRPEERNPEFDALLEEASVHILKAKRA